MLLRHKLFRATYRSMWGSIWELLGNEIIFVRNISDSNINKSVVLPIQMSTYRSVEMQVERKVAAYEFTR